METSKIKIALSGPHGTGKSIATKALVEWARKRWAHLKVGLAQSCTRQSPLPINESGTPQGQKWIYHAKMLQELEAAENFDVVIWDRSIWDVLVYSTWGANKDRWTAEWDFVVFHLDQFFLKTG